MSCVSVAPLALACFTIWSQRSRAGLSSCAPPALELLRRAVVADLKFGHYMRKRAPALEGGCYKRKKSQEHSQEWQCHRRRAAFR